MRSAAGQRGKGRKCAKFAIRLGTRTQLCLRSPAGQLLTYLSVMLDERPVAYGFITDGYLIGFAKGFIKNGEKQFVRSKNLLLINAAASIQGLLGYFRASREDFGLPPTMIGTYTVRGRIGAGGTSCVFAGADPDDNQVALKMIFEPHRDELEHERDIVHKLRSSAHASESLDTSIFLRSLPEMELLVWHDNGKEHKAGAVTPLGAPLRRPLGRDGLECVLRALCVAHHADFVHRDIRPPNLIFDVKNSSQVLLIDFGFAAEVGKETRYAGSPYLQPDEATRAQLVKGTYKPWPMHDLAQLLQVLAYHADLLTVGGFAAVRANERIVEGTSRVMLPENVLLTALARLVAAAAEMPGALPPDIAQGGLEALISSALKAARGESAAPLTQTVRADMDDAGAQDLRDMVLSSIASAKEAFLVFPNLAPLASADVDEQLILNGIKHRPQRTLDGRWAWYEALHTVLASTTICKAPTAFLDGLTIARLDIR